MNAALLCEWLGVGVRTAYCVMKQLKDKGIIQQEAGRWRTNIAKQV